MNHKLLILDLDETLIHATNDRLRDPPDFQAFGYHVYQRPGLRAFLEYCLNHFQVAVWTAASADFARVVIAEIFKEDETLEFVWARDKCTRRYDHEMMKSYWIKKLLKVKKLGYDIRHVLAVDDTPRKWEQSYGNLIPMPEWEGQPQDTYLATLQHYLSTLRTVENVRQIDKRFWWDMKT